MKKFRFPLESYLQIKKVREQQKLGELARVMSQVNVFRAQQQAFEDEYNHLLQQQREKFMRESLPIESVRAMYEYLGALRTRRDTATRNIAQLESEVNEKRNAYHAARKDRRVIEILKERRLMEHRAAAEREEIALMDEFNGARSKHNSLLRCEQAQAKQEEQR
jgi:flagellar FliJ protein